MGCPNVLPAVTSSQPKAPTVQCDVGDIPATVQFNTRTIVEVKGKNAEALTLMLDVGKYIISEMLKNVYTKDFRGRLKVYDRQYMIVAEKTF